MAAAVSCIAVIGRQNNPLFLKSFPPVVAGGVASLSKPKPFADMQDLKFHYVVHTSLDMIEEKGTAP